MDMPSCVELLNLAQDIREAVDYGVVKMNIDTDTQWFLGCKGE